MFLIAPAPNVIDRVLRPGAVAVFVSEATLRAAARNPAGLRFPPTGGSLQDDGHTVREEFMVAGREFAVAMPMQSARGAGAFLPWIILAGGLVLATLAGALSVIAARRARAQRDFDRDLAESRARMVRAGEEARRRFERDLHDGAQQRLVNVVLELRLAEKTWPPTWMISGPCFRASRPS
ncbi:histidine kinase [Solirubrobacter ginsenosidimutans]|uniref:Histidine kinase n=1 Tax=Solirubrobacter ginsenosidimutans TaxID=490573 RepID=A0A9X3MPT0_9ACTN|nr:histidine kinase [Solirubrobacter ginsenosidimutans]MDA0159566.1 histidine kinase [Solirubrobacter ginsenosidimutans]